MGWPQQQLGVGGKRHLLLPFSDAGFFTDAPHDSCQVAPKMGRSVWIFLEDSVSKLSVGRKAHGKSLLGTETVIGKWKLYDFATADWATRGVLKINEDINRKEMIKYTFTDRTIGFPRS